MAQSNSTLASTVTGEDGRNRASLTPPLRRHQRSWDVTFDELLKEKRDEILRVCARHGARNVRVFGSVARGEADEKSDLDLLVEFEPESSLLDQAALVLELEQLLGRRVDVVSEGGLYWLLRRRILKEARVL